MVNSLSSTHYCCTLGQVRQLRAAVELDLSLWQNWIISWYTYHYYMDMCPSSIYSWSHFGTWILLFWLFVQLWAVRKKNGFEFFWETFEGGFFQLFCGQTKTKFFFWKYCRVRTKKLHKIKFFVFFWILKQKLWILDRRPLMFYSWV
jgi:hypothetical protein